MPTPLSSDALMRAGYMRHSARAYGGRWYWTKVVPDGRGGSYAITVWECVIGGIIFGHDVTVSAGRRSAGFQAATVEEVEGRAAEFMVGRQDPPDG